MRVVNIVALLLASLCFSSCSAPKSKRCKAICEREAECAEKTQVKGFKFDKGECVASCTALERDEEGRDIVARHAACVEQAGASCKMVFECK
jgi:hypothetical protein